MSRANGDRAGSALGRRDIIYFSCLAWGPVKARPHQITLQMARTNRVLYVEPMLSIATRAFQGFESPLPRLRRISSGLFVYTPPSFLPFSLKSSLANRINKCLLRESVKRVVKRLGFNRPILGVSHPQDEALLGHFRECVSFYDCMDNYSALPEPRANPALVARMERQLLRKTDHIFVSSRRLFESLNGFREKCTLVRNGVVASQFDDPGHGPDPRELHGIPEPLIGYVGTLGTWIDGEALAFLARTRPGWSMVLIGPVLDRSLAKRLRSFRNVHLLGTKCHEELPRLVRRFAVALIPFALTRLTQAVDPIKLYEYLAAGKPVVTSDLPEVRRFGDLVSIYHSCDQLVRLVEFHLQETGTMEQARRRLAAMDNTWEDRVACMALALSRRFQPLKKS